MAPCFTHALPTCYNAHFECPQFNALFTVFPTSGFIFLSSLEVKIFLCCSKAATAAETEEKTAGFLFLLFFLFYMSRKKEGKGKVWMNHKVLVFCMNVAAPGIAMNLQRNRSAIDCGFLGMCEC